MKTGVNAQAGIDCKAIKGTIGHNGISANAEVIIAEGSWVETGLATETWVIAKAKNIAIIDIPMPQ